jgi:hypothetical protein
MNAQKATARISEIEGLLNAHRQGWTSWSPQSLREFQAERLALLESIKGLSK